MIQKSSKPPGVRSYSTGDVNKGAVEPKNVKLPQVPSLLDVGRGLKYEDKSALLTSNQHEDTNPFLTSASQTGEHKEEEHKKERPDTFPEIHRKIKFTGKKLSRSQSRSQNPTPKGSESPSPEIPRREPHENFDPSDRSSIQRISPTPGKQFELNDSGGEKKSDDEKKHKVSILTRVVTRTTSRKGDKYNRKNSSAPGSPYGNRVVTLELVQRKPKFTRTDAQTPRGLKPPVNALPPSEEVRDAQEKEFLAALKDPNSTMGDRVRKLGREVGLRFSENLAEIFEDVLKPIPLDSRSKKKKQLNTQDEINIQAPFAIHVAKKISKAIDNPFVWIASLVCLDVALELAAEFAKWKIDVDSYRTAGNLFNEKISGGGVKPLFVDREGTLSLRARSRRLRHGSRVWI